MINKEFKIDYLQFSAERTPQWLANAQEDIRKRSNKQFYTHMTKYLNGAVSYEGNVNTDKKLFVLSGAVCSRIGITPEWVKSLIDDDGIVSRIDLCMTCDDNILTKIQRDHKHIMSEMYNKIQIISDVEYTPQTIYIGDFEKRKTKGIVRAYDKGLQMKIEGVSMYRIEVELKQKHAKIAAKRYAHGEAIPSLMNGKFRIERKWYDDIFGNDISTMRFNDVSKLPVQEIDRKMAWLESQVVPSLKYVIDYDKENGTHNFKLLMKRLGMDYQEFDNT